MTSKFLTTIASAVLVLGLAACSGPADAPKAGDAMKADAMKTDSMASDAMKTDSMAADPMKPADSMAADPMKPADH